jgi:hypothetical protein
MEQGTMARSLGECYPACCMEIMKAVEKKKEEEDEFFRMLEPKKELNETLGRFVENMITMRGNL